MERQIIEAMKYAVHEIDVYHDFAPEAASLPYVVIQRVGGEGALFLDHRTDGGYSVRLQVAVWDSDRLSAIEISRAIEKALVSLAEVKSQGAAVAAYDAATGLRGMRQDFMVIS